MKRHTIKIKRIYEPAESGDGYRVLVDRLWPRGVSKELAALDEWDKDLAPSTDLRKWFDHQPALFVPFQARYREELKDKSEALKRLRSIAVKQNLTLLYAAKDPQCNHAVVLLNVINEL